MPEYGELRTANGETRFWTGTGWKRTENQSGPEPDSFTGGFLRHLVEKEPAARNALLSGAALTTGGAAPAVAAAAPFVGRGMEYLSKLLHGENPLPDSGSELVGDLAGDATEAALSLYGGPLLAKGARAVGVAKDAVTSRLPAVVRNLGRASTALNPNALAMDAITSKPVLSAVEEFGDQFTPDGARQAFGRVAEGLRPGAASSGGGRYVVPKEVPYRMSPGKASAETGRAVQGREMFDTGYGDFQAPERALRSPYNSAPAESAPSMDVLHGADMYHGSSYDDVFPETDYLRRPYVSESPTSAYQPDMFDQQAIERMPPSMRTFLHNDLSRPGRYEELRRSFGGHAPL